MERGRTRSGQMDQGQRQEQWEEGSAHSAPDDDNRPHQRMASTVEGTEVEVRVREAVAWTYGYRRRSIGEEPILPGWWGDGFYQATHQEAYDAELIAIMRGVHHLVSRREQGNSFTIFTDSQTE